MKRFLIFSLFFSLALFAFANDDDKRVVKIEHFTSDALTESELTTIETMVASFVVELHSFKVISPDASEKSLRELENAFNNGDTSKSVQTLSSDYILSAHIGKIGDIFVFSMDNTKVVSGEKLSVSENCASINEIVLKARNLTRKLFGKEDTEYSEEATQTEIETVEKSFINIENLLGVWKGDKGLDSIRILRVDGSALALLSGGIAMKLKIEVSESAYIFTQDQANKPEFYLSQSIPYSKAKIIAEKARAMKWTLSPSKDGKSLKGIKESVSISYNSDGSINVDNTYSREAVWYKLQ